MCEEAFSTGTCARQQFDHSQRAERTGPASTIELSSDKIVNYMGLEATKPVCFRQSETQSSLLSYKNYLENYKFACSKF